MGGGLARQSVRCGMCGTALLRQQGQRLDMEKKLQLVDDQVGLGSVWGLYWRIGSSNVNRPTSPFLQRNAACPARCVPCLSLRRSALRQWHPDQRWEHLHNARDRRRLRKNKAKTGKMNTFHCRVCLAVQSTLPPFHGPGRRSGSHQVVRVACAVCRNDGSVCVTPMAVR